MRRWVILGLMALAGCQPAVRTENMPMLPVTQVPKAVRCAALAQYPTLRFHTAWRLPDGGYQMRGLNPAGVNVDVAYSVEGSALRVR